MLAIHYDRIFLLFLFPFSNVYCLTFLKKHSLFLDFLQVHGGHSYGHAEGTCMVMADAPPHPQQL